MKVIGIIPARFASTRFPGKPLQLIQGKPLLQWVVEVVQKSKTLSDFYVATDHQGIVDLCQKINVKYIMTSESAATGTDRVHEACQKIKAQGVDFEAAINIQGDEPLLPVEYIDVLVKAFKTEAGLEMATLAHPLMAEDINNLNVVKVLVNQKQYAIYFSRLAIPFSREQNFENLTQNKSVQKHIGLYGYSTMFLEKFCRQAPTFLEKSESLEQLRALDMGAQIKVISVSQPTYGVDTPDDLKKVEQLLKNNGNIK